MLSCIPLTAYLTQLHLGQIIQLCNYKETVHRIDSVNLFSILKKGRKSNYNMTTYQRHGSSRSRSRADLNRYLFSISYESLKQGRGNQTIQTKAK